MSWFREGAATFVVAALLAFAVRCSAAPVGFWWLLVPALAIAIAFAAGDESTSSWVAFRRGWLFGTLFVLGDLAWVIVPAAAHLGPVLYVIAVAICALEALPVAIAAWAFARTDGVSAIGFCAGVPALYALLETLRASGPLGLPLATLGASQTSGPFAVTLAIGAIPFATFATLAAAATIVYLVRGIRESRMTPRHVRTSASVCGVAVVVVLAANVVWLGGLAARVRSPLARIGIVEAGPVGLSRSFASTAKDYADATQRLPHDIDFALWPEGVLYLIASDGAAQRAIASDAARRFGRPILAGATHRVGTLLHNDVLEIDPSGTISIVYTKRRLVPFGEYQPFAYGGTKRATYAAATNLEPPVRVGDGTPFGALICYEIVFADLTRASANTGGRYLVAVLNDSWFGETDGPGQLAQVLAADAIASGISIVRIDTVPPSGVIDASGAWVGEPLRAEGTAVIAVPPGIETPYRFMGWRFANSVLLVVALFTLPRVAFRRRKLRPRRSFAGSAKR